MLLFCENLSVMKREASDLLHCPDPLWFPECLLSIQLQFPPWMSALLWKDRLTIENHVSNSLFSTTSFREILGGAIATFIFSKGLLAANLLGIHQTLLRVPLSFALAAKNCVLRGRTGAVKSLPCLVLWHHYGSEETRVGQEEPDGLKHLAGFNFAW